MDGLSGAALSTRLDFFARERAKVMHEGVIRYSTRSFPDFGEGPYDEENPPAGVVSSPYYWWFQFLRLNDDYAALSAADSRYAAVFAELGDVRIVGFKPWWDEHSYAFAEPITEFELSIARRRSDLAPLNDPNAMNVVVPVTWGRKTVLRRFKEVVLSQIPEAQTGVQVSGSQAKFRLNGRWNVGAMDRAVRVYKIRRSHAELPWPDVGIMAQLVSMNVDLSPAERSDLRRTAGILADRHYNRALKYIQAAASFEFPHVR